MQTAERLAELDAARGREADVLWFEMMKDHHRGGAHMAEHASLHGAREDVMTFAGKMHYNQLIEVVEYENAQERLGLLP
jgi:uncharacterized protein (DUF305 family)